MQRNQLGNITRIIRPKSGLAITTACKHPEELDKKYPVFIPEK
jgi:hypothetical protein